jgi:hypothetical protein
MADRKRNNKAKGNRFERSISATLSKWMFNDGTILYRSLSSGGRKVAYRGDVVPIKQLPDILPEFIFYFEVKSGYNSQISTLYDQRLVRAFIQKAELDMTDEQRVLWLIIKHDYKPPFVVTNTKIVAVDHMLILNLIESDYYIYLLSDILGISFKDYLTSIIF